jgi:hypothetical protein
MPERERGAAPEAPATRQARRWGGSSATPRRGPARGLLLPLLLAAVLSAQTLLPGRAEAQAPAETTQELLLLTGLWRVDGDYLGERYNDAVSVPYSGDFEDRSAHGSLTWLQRRSSRHDRGPRGSNWIEDRFRRRHVFGGSLRFEREWLDDTRGTETGTLNGWWGEDDRVFDTLELQGAARIFLGPEIALRAGAGLAREEAFFDIHRNSEQTAFTMRNRERSDVVRNSTSLDAGVELYAGDRARFVVQTELALQRETWDGTGSIVLPGYVEGETYQLDAVYRGGDVGLGGEALVQLVPERLLLEAAGGAAHQVLDGRSLSSFESGPRIPGDFRQTMKRRVLRGALHAFPLQRLRISLSASYQRWEMERRETLQAGSEEWLFDEDWDGVEHVLAAELEWELTRRFALRMMAGRRRLDWDRLESETRYDRSARGAQSGPLLELGMDIRF